MRKFIAVIALASLGIPALITAPRSSVATPLAHLSDCLYGSFVPEMLGGQAWFGAWVEDCHPSTDLIIKITPQESIGGIWNNRTQERYHEVVGDAREEFWANENCDNQDSSWRARINIQDDANHSDKFFTPVRLLPC